MNRVEVAQKSHAFRRPRPLTWLSLAVPLLSACGQNASVPANLDPYAGGVTHPWSYTAPADTISAQSLTADINTLSFEKLLSAKNGWGPIERDRSNGEQAAGDGKPLNLPVGFYTYTRGFGVHSNSEMRFSLKGTNGATCKSFSARVGLDDEVDGRGSVVFQVYLDGVKAYDSGIMRYGLQFIHLDIRGKKELRLIVTDAGDGISYDHADWANPQVDCRDAGTTKPGTLDPSYGVGGFISKGTYDDNDHSGEAALEPDGSIVYLVENTYQPVYIRLRPDGTVQRVIGETGFPYESIIRQPDGKFVVGGTLRNELSVFLALDGRGFLLARLNADLSPDKTFGDGGKREAGIPDLCPVAPNCRGVPENSKDIRDTLLVTSVDRQADGKILMAGYLDRRYYTSGYTGAETYLRRFTADGAGDPSFGTNGAVFIESFRSARILPKPDGKILVFFQRPDDQRNEDSATRLIVRQLNANGSLDRTFGVDGQLDKGRAFASSARLDLNGDLLLETTASNVLQAERISPTGKTLVTSYPKLDQKFAYLRYVTFKSDGSRLALWNDNGSGQNYLIRLRPDLSLDTTFGTDGKTPVDYSAHQILAQADGKVIVTSPLPFTAARYFP